MIFQATTWMTSLRTGCFHFRNGKLQCRYEVEKQERKLEDCLSTARLQLSLARMYLTRYGFSFKMNPVYVSLSGMLHVYKSEAHVAVFET